MDPDKRSVPGDKWSSDCLDPDRPPPPQPPPRPLQDIRDTIDASDVLTHHSLAVPFARSRAGRGVHSPLNFMPAVKPKGLAL